MNFKWPELIPFIVKLSRLHEWLYLRKERTLNEQVPLSDFLIDMENQDNLEEIDLDVELDLDCKYADKIGAT